MLSSLCHSGLPSAPLPQSVSTEGSQTVSTMGASTVSTSGEEQKGVAAESERPTAPFPTRLYCHRRILRPRFHY